METKTSPSPARPVIWLIIILGILAIIAALFFMFGNGGSVPFGFTADTLLALGILFAIVGLVLFFILPPVTTVSAVDTAQIDRSINDVDTKTKLLAERLSTLETQVTDNAQIDQSIHEVDTQTKLLAERLNTLETQVTGSTPSKPVSIAGDLTIIEGIGPKIRDALVAARIDTFEKLADATDDRLKAAIKAGGTNFAPSLPTWSKQAGMVVRGELAAFEQYKDTLIAGRAKK